MSSGDVVVGGLVLLPVMGLAAVVTSTSDPTAQVEAIPPLMARAALVDTRGQDIGNVVLTQVPEGVRIALSVSGLPQGSLALHIHEKGICDVTTKFASAGAHFNPMGKMHGLHHEEGPHAGDMPNIAVNAAGKADVSVVNPAVSLVKGVPNSVLDADGSAIVIHAKPDDNVSQPAGNAGDRLACGVIKEG